MENTKPRMARPPAPVRSYRTPGRVVQMLGLVLVIGGAAAVLWGSVLPWLSLHLFGLPVLVPGVIGFGSITAVCGLLALAFARSQPLLAVLLGLVCLGIGSQAERIIGRTVARHILEVRQRLAPINARLEQANLPPVEPFGESVVARQYVGPGPFWILWGGLALVAGGSLRYAGGRLERTCAYCGAHWHSGREIHFCPQCGRMALIAARCTRCFTSLQKRDRFCANCGEAAPVRTNPRQKGADSGT